MAGPGIPDGPGWTRHRALSASHPSLYSAPSHRGVGQGNSVGRRVERAGRYWSAITASHAATESGRSPEGAAKRSTAQPLTGAVSGDPSGSETRRGSADVVPWRAVRPWGGYVPSGARSPLLWPRSGSDGSFPQITCESKGFPSVKHLPLTGPIWALRSRRTPSISACTRRHTPKSTPIPVSTVAITS